MAPTGLGVALVLALLCLVVAPTRASVFRGASEMEELRLSRRGFRNDLERRPAAPAASNVVEYNLTVSYGFWSPDCVLKQVYLVNGQFPGPTITATEGDTLRIRVFNDMGMEGLTIHWHGFRQLNTNIMDGAAHVTQCPISNGDYFVYQFKADKAGTYMYHGHHDDQVTGGVYGAVVVNEAPSMPFSASFDEERQVILSDWWHRSVYEQITGLNQNPFQFIGEAQAMLINGRGKYDCGLVPAATTPLVAGDSKICVANNTQCDRSIINVEAGKTYRLRIICITSLASLNFYVEGHTFTVVAADGYEVQPYDVGTEGLDIYSGQTVDVLLTANQTADNYWVRTSVIARNNAKIGLAVLRYSGAAMADPTTPTPPGRAFNDHPAALAQLLRYKAKGGLPKVGITAYPNPNTYVLVGAQQLIDGHIKWAINNISFVAPSIPYNIGLNRKKFSLYKPIPSNIPLVPWNYSAPAPFPANPGSGYYTFPPKKFIDIVLQNTNNLGPGASEYHPWHMHGHNFWVLAYGDGTYNQATDSSKYNLVDPPYRNTVTVTPYGWVAIRFFTDNPGLWFLHCHIASHLHMGMAVVFKDGYGPVKLPKGFPTCGLHDSGWP